MHEIICVVDPASPAGSGRQDLEVEAVDGEALAPGYYFVLWRERGRPPHRELLKRYFGPFPSRVEARLLQASALSLGLEANTQATRQVVECRAAVRQSQNSGMTPPPSRPASARPPAAVAA